MKDAHGSLLTETEKRLKSRWRDNFPKNHLYHRGMYWAWPHIKIGGRDEDRRTIRRREIISTRYAWRSPKSCTLLSYLPAIHSEIK